MEHVATSQKARGIVIVYHKTKVASSGAVSLNSVNETLSLKKLWWVPK